MVYASTHLSVSPRRLALICWVMGRRGKLLDQMMYARLKKHTKKHDSDFSVHAVLRAIQYNVENN